MALPRGERSYLARKMKNLGEIYNINEVQSLYLPLVSFKQKHILVQFCVFSKSVKIDGGSAKSHKVETIPIDRLREGDVI